MMVRILRYEWLLSAPAITPPPALPASVLRAVRAIVPSRCGLPAASPGLGTPDRCTTAAGWRRHGVPRAPLRRNCALMRPTLFYGGGKSEFAAFAEKLNPET